MDQQNSMKLVVAGAGFGDIINLIEAIKEKTPQLDFIGFVDDKPELEGALIFGYPVIGKFDWLKSERVHIFNSVAKTMAIRAAATKKLSACGSDFASLVHPTVNTRYSSIGVDVAIFENVFLGPNTSVGSHTIVHSGCMIGHDVSIGENCFIAPGAQILGGVKIGDNVAIGANSVCLPKSLIGDGATVGAASLVSGIVATGATMLGVPARKFFGSAILRKKE